MNIQDISKSLGGRDILSNFSLDLDPGMRLCVCGANGTGKSTLLRILSGVEQPDSGRVILPRGCRLGYVEQELDESLLGKTLLDFVREVLPDWEGFWEEWEEASASGDESALKRLMERQAEWEAVYGHNPEHRAERVLSGLGFSRRKWGRTLSALSGGWRERAKLARVLTAGADVLLLDEPTNHLDIEAVEWLESYLMEFEGIAVFVAHDRVFMDKVGTHVLYLSGEKAVFRKASFSRFLELMAELETQRELKAKALTEEIDRKMAFVERFRAKATKARQASSQQKMAKRLEKELQSIPRESRRRELSFTWPPAPKSEKTVVGAADLAFKFADGGTLWPPLTFTIYREQRIALVGPNGCGKSTLLKLVAGVGSRSGGSMMLGQSVRLGYFSQHQMETLNASGSVLGEIRRLSDPRTTEEELMSVLGLFMLGQNYFDRQVDTLSGGEKSRLILAALFLARCNFLVLDEPTNHLDLESREALINALSRFDGTLLMVAHDRWLLSHVADEVWAVSDRGLSVYDGYEAYDAARKTIASETPDDAAGRAGGTSPQPRRDASGGAASSGLSSLPPESFSLSREEQKKLKREEAERRNALHRRLKPLQERYDGLERELETLMAEQDEISMALADPEIYADRQKAPDLLKRFAELKDLTEKIMEDMADLEEKINSTE